MAISKEDVLKAASLARMELSPEEVEMFSRQLESILGFIDQLKEADVSGVSPMNHVLDIQNVLRQDNPGVSLEREAVLENAPKRTKGIFRCRRLLNRIIKIFSFY